MKHIIHIIIIVVVTGTLYFPSLNNEYIWDDDAYVYNNFSIQQNDGIKDIWLTYKMPQYYPMVFTSYWIEHKLWGLDPFGYHVTNLIIHIFNAIIIYIILLNLYSPLAFASALIFALHPVQVETVAWISERKNILSGFFYFSAIFFYIKYIDLKQLKFYIFSFLSFFLSLMSKSISVSFVFIPLFIKWWRGKEISRKDFLELVPFFLIGMVSGINTIFVEITKVGATGEKWSLPFFGHVVLVGKILSFYFAKIFYPNELIFFYERWNIDATHPSQWINVIIAIMLFILLYKLRDDIGRGGIANYAYFILAMFPALGIINVYPMIYSYVADHFQYIASINIIILLTGATAFLYEKTIKKWYLIDKKITSIILYTGLFMISIFYGTKIIEHSKTFANTETLWKDVTIKNDNSWAAHNNLGLVYSSQGKITEAIDEFTKTIDIYPSYTFAHNNLGLLYYSIGEKEKALTELFTVINLDKNYAPAYNNIGIIYANDGLSSKAFDYFINATKIDPNMIEARYSLADYYYANREFAKCIEELRKAIELKPNFIEAMALMAKAYEQTGQTENAIYWRNRAGSNN